MRLFIALNLSEAVHGQLRELLDELPKQVPDAKWVKPESVHLTLSFLGNLAEEQVPELKHALDVIAANHAPLNLFTSEGGTFGSPKKPRVLWLGMKGELVSLQRLQRDVSEAMKAFGVDPDTRPYSPHLTLARSRFPSGDPKLVQALEPLSSISPERSDSGELQLIQSHLSPQGAHYEVLHRAVLTGAGETAHPA